MWDNEISTRNCYHCKTQDDGTVACNKHDLSLLDNDSAVLTIEQVSKDNRRYWQCLGCPFIDCAW